MHPNRSFSEHAKKFWIFPKGIEGGKLNKLIIRHDAALKAMLNEQEAEIPEKLSTGTVFSFNDLELQIAGGFLGRRAWLVESGGITWLFHNEFYPYPGAVRAIRLHSTQADVRRVKSWDGIQPIPTLKRLSAMPGRFIRLIQKDWRRENVFDSHSNL